MFAQPEASSDGTEKELGLLVKQVGVSCRNLAGYGGMELQEVWPVDGEDLRPLINFGEGS